MPIKHQNKYRTSSALEALAPFLMTVGKGQIDCFHSLPDILDSAAITVFEVAAEFDDLGGMDTHPRPGIRL
jgi:hypothetical protein